jgi:hypothetical protein
VSVKSSYFNANCVYPDLDPTCEILAAGRMNSFNSKSSGGGASAAIGSVSSLSAADVLKSALAKLARNNFPIEMISQINGTGDWENIRSHFDMSLAEIFAIKRLKMSLTSAELEVVGEDFSSSPAHSLTSCLDAVPDVTVLQSLIGPGPCLYNFLNKDTSLHVSKTMIETIVTCQLKELTDLPIKPSIDIELLLAIRLYTLKFPIPFYQYINQVLNSVYRAELADILPYMRLLTTALYAMEACGYGTSTQAYRGVKTSNCPALKAKFDDDRNAFSADSLITFAGFTSVTRVASQAEPFAESFFFHFLEVRGVDISTISAFPTEKELLVIPPAVFRVGGSCLVNGQLTVPLTHVEQAGASYLRRVTSTASVEVS